MAGVLFVACIPTKEYEKELNHALIGENKSSTKRNVTILQKDFEDAEQVSLLGSVESPDSEETYSSNQDRCSIVTEKSKGPTTPKRSSLDYSKDTAKSEESAGKDVKREKKLEILPDMSMEETALCLLKSLKVENYSWVTAKSDKFIHVIFSVADGPPCEQALHVLTKWGIGIRCKSTLGIIPCTLFYKAEDLTTPEDDEDKKKDSRKSGWDDFVLSVVRSRLAVAQVVESVKGDARLTFDYVSLIILAGTIAAVGLVENSVVSIVASMLISPLMGPILAGTFGTVIHDRKLQLMGVRNELIGLALTILTGYVIGLVIGSIDDYYGGDQWPTQEMLSRCLLRSLWVGILIALPSGAGIALGILGNNSGSLIGVAISASLLPPAVNAGLLWSLATLEVATGGEKTEAEIKKLAEKIYSNHLPSEYALLGCVSLSLTLVNIFCIFLAGIVILKIKEVAPRAPSDETQQFWRHDIKVARDYNRTFGKEDASQFEKQLAQELAAVYSGDDESNDSSSNGEVNEFRKRLTSLYHFSPDTLRRINGPRHSNQFTWSPSLSSADSRRLSLRELEMLYTSLGGAEPPRLPLAGHLAKLAQLRSMRNSKPEDVPGLAPISESNSSHDREEGRGRNFLRRNNRSRFTSEMNEEGINDSTHTLLPQLQNYYGHIISNRLTEYNAIQRLEEQLGSVHNSLNSLEGTHEDISLGARRDGKMSVVRRFFCLFVLFDLLLISLTWLLCIMVMNSDKLIDILKMQILQYNISTSIFDIVLAAICRFTVLLLFYGLLQLSTTCIVALTTLGTCVFLIFKAVYYSINKGGLWRRLAAFFGRPVSTKKIYFKSAERFFRARMCILAVAFLIFSSREESDTPSWSSASQPAFQVILVLISFVIAWSEAWFLDFRVLPKELSALIYAQSSGRFSESLGALLLDRNLRNPVMRQFLRDMASEIEGPAESNGNFYSPLESPNLSEDESDDGRHLYINAEQNQASRGFVKVGRSSRRKTLGDNNEYLRRGKDTLEVAWSLLNDSDWKLQKTSSEGDTIYSKHEVHLGRVFLLRTKINISAQKLLEELFLNVDKFTAWNKTVLESRKVLSIDEQTDITYQVSTPGGNGVISSRDFVSLRRWDIKEDCFVLAAISIPYSGLPPIKQYIRGENGPCCWVMRSLGDDHDSCMFEFLLNTNLKGWIPQYVLETALTSVLLEYSACLKKHCQTLINRDAT